MTTIAIDFGTSNTIVSVINPFTQKPETLRLEGLSQQLLTPMGIVFSVPTIVFIQPDRILIGAPVREQRLGFAQPDRYFANFKRDLIAVYQPPDRLIDGQSYSAAFVAELFLAQLWTQITAQVTPTQVILTVPIGAFEHYVDWFRGVAARLDFPQPMWVDESTAAALGYAVQQPDQICLVVDCGGGTIDLSLVKTLAAQRDQPQLKAQVLAKSDAYMGGADIDIWIVEDYLRRQTIDRSTVSAIGWQNLLEIAERLKIQLSQLLEAKDSWFDDENFIAYELQYSRSQLEVILEDQQFLEQLRQSIDEVFVLAMDKGIRKSDIDAVLLVGGSAAIPAIQQLLRLYFGSAKLKYDQPLEAVAHGALALTKLTAIADELRHAYAIRLWDPQPQSYIFYPIFAKGTAYPCVSPPPLMILQAAIAGQTEIRLDIGELADIRQAVIEYDSQGQVSTTHLNPTQAFQSLPTTGQTCIARLSPAGQLGIDRVTVEFAVTADRQLVATVQDLLTQQVLLDRRVVAQL